MSESKRPIIMRSNRLLGAALVDKNLISVEQLDAATERFLQALDTGPEHVASILNVLVNDTKTLTEEALLEHLVDEHQLGLVDLRDIDLADDVKLQLKSPDCWATWTVPFDKDEDVNYVASAYYLSVAVRQFWEKQLGGPIIWFGTTLESIAEFLEKLEAERSSQNAAVATAGAA